MAKHPKRWTVKRFREALEARLAACSMEELREILRRMADAVRPSERRDFLEKLELHPEDRPEAGDVEPTLVDAIDAFREDVLLRFEESEPPIEESWWGHEEEDDSYGDLEAEYAELFRMADALFAAGDMGGAAPAYAKLFEIADLEDEYGRGIRLSEPEGSEGWRSETAARYLRAVYESRPPGERPKALFEGVKGVAERVGRGGIRLEDIEEISRDPLPDRDRFLRDWQAFLRGEEGALADALLREVTRLREGTEGLARLARADGARRPRAYLDWFDALEEEGSHRKVLTEARKALKALPEGLPIRAAIADRLFEAAREVGQARAARDARWEAFQARPNVDRLLDLWEAAPTGARRWSWMRRVPEWIHAHPRSRRVEGTAEDAWLDDDLETPEEPDDYLLAHACLLAGDWEAAQRLVARQKVLGWSYASRGQALVVCASLAYLAHAAAGEFSPRIARLLRGAVMAHKLGYPYAFRGFGGDEDEDEDEDVESPEPLLEREERIYRETIAALHLDPEVERTFLAWCLRTARRRAEAILGKKRRRAYARAAELLAACSDVLRLRGEGKRADALVSSFRTRYSRFSAFQREFRRALRGCAVT